MMPFQSFSQNLVIEPLIVQPSEFTSNFINNQTITSNAERWMLVHNPATGDVITRVPRSTTAEIEVAINSSSTAYQAWSVANKGERQDRLRDLAALTKIHEGHIAMTLAIETGRTLPDALSEVRRGVDMIQTAAAAISRLGERGEMRSNMQVFTDRFSLGVSLVVTPFNMPFLVPLWSIPFSIAMGNTVLLKPSELCPTAALWIGLLMREAGFPPGVLNIVNGEGGVVQEIIKNPEIKTVSFVGSEAAGIHVYDSSRLERKKVQANISGQNHLVILPDSPKDFAIHALVESAFGAAGQRCTSPKVAVLVGESSQWICDIVARAKRLVVGESSDPQVNLGPMITARAREKMLALIADGIQEGATLELDGRSFTHERYPLGHWLAPSIFSGVTPQMACYKEEIFGPLLLCMSVASLEDAIDLINSNRFGNGASIFTNSGAYARQFQRFAKVGLININNPQTAPSASWSFTSNKDSFLGESNFYGEDAINFFTYTKTVTSLWHHPDQQTIARTPRTPTFHGPS